MTEADLINTYIEKLKNRYNEQVNSYILLESRMDLIIKDFEITNGRVETLEKALADSEEVHREEIRLRETELARRANDCETLGRALNAAQSELEVVKEQYAGAMLEVNELKFILTKFNALDPKITTEPPKKKAK